LAYFFKARERLMILQQKQQQKREAEGIGWDGNANGQSSIDPSGSPRLLARQPVRRRLGDSHSQTHIPSHFEVGWPNC
jgi:hypothetical protein